MDSRKRVVGWLLALTVLAGGVSPVAARILVPMDLKQTDHLKAYGLAYWVLAQGATVEWCLNYRGGAFLIDETPAMVKEAKIRGVKYDLISEGAVTEIYADIEKANMDVILLEKAPRVAIYIPPGFVPWDDAVTLAFTYAEIPYTAIWDTEVLQGGLGKFDWLHLHHEDFTGQYGRFYAAFRNTDWYKRRVIDYEHNARAMGFAKVSQAKLAVVETIRDWVARGGFLFAMCSATDSFDLALAAANTDICAKYYDGDPADPSAQSKLDYTRSFAFEGFAIEENPMVYEFTKERRPGTYDGLIDMTQIALKRGEKSDYFALFEFSAKQDPVPTMLTQNHTNVVKGFLGATTSFNKSHLKDGVLILAEPEGAQDARYIHGAFGQGTFTWLGGHDPEDWQHRVGDPPTNLSLHRNSPGYRLILNNVLFPAAEKKKQKT